MVLLCINGVERVLCKSWIESYSSTANVWENCKLMCLRYCTNATYATLVLQALYPCWSGATFSRWRAQRHFFLPCCIRLVGEKQLPLITLPLQITLFSLTKKLFFFFFFLWGCGVWNADGTEVPVSVISFYGSLWREEFPCLWLR